MDQSPTHQPQTEISRLSVEELFERFLRLSVADGSASPRTLRSYREGLALYFSWCSESQQPLDPQLAGFDHIQEYRRWLSERYKPNTCRLRLAAVRVLYQALQRWGRRSDNPAAGVKAAADHTPAFDRVLKQALDPKEALLLWQSIHLVRLSDRRDRAIIGLMLWNGLRAGEVVNLEWRDVSMPGCPSITVDGKGDKERVVPLAQEARWALNDWMQLGAFTIEGFNPVFFTWDNQAQPLTVRTIERITDKWLRACHLKRPGRSAHCLRHTYAVLAVLGGADREVLGDTMGHSRLTTTDIYIRAAARHQAGVAEAAWKAANREVNNMTENQIGTGKDPQGQAVTYVQRGSIVVVLDARGEKITHSDRLEYLQKVGYTVNDEQGQSPGQVIPPGNVGGSAEPAPDSPAPEEAPAS